MGAPVKWDGLHARYTYDFQLDPSWKREDMKVVAVLSAFDSSDPTLPRRGKLCVNGAQQRGGLVKTETVAAEAVPEAYFDLCGTPLEKLCQRHQHREDVRRHREKILIQ